MWDGMFKKPSSATVPVRSVISSNIFILCLVVLLALHVSPTRRKAVSFFKSFPYMYLGNRALRMLMLPIVDDF
jgi:hypothetical protein